MALVILPVAFVLGLVIRDARRATAAFGGPRAGSGLGVWLRRRGRAAVVCWVGGWAGWVGWWGGGVGGGGFSGWGALFAVFFVVPAFFLAGLADGNAPPSKVLPPP